MSVTFSSAAGVSLISSVASFSTVATVSGSAVSVSDSVALFSVLFDAPDEELDLPVFDDEAFAEATVVLLCEAAGVCSFDLFAPRTAPPPFEG